MLQPPTLMPYFWAVWMYPLTPFTYIIEGFMANIMGNGVPLICETSELNIFQPPQGQTCGEWGNPYTLAVKGLVYNPDATSNCEYCAFANGDQFLASLNLYWSHRWRDFGIIIGYAIFNVLAILCLFYFFRIKQWKKAVHSKSKKALAAETEKEAALPNASETSSSENEIKPMAGLVPMDASIVEKHLQSAQNLNHLKPADAAGPKASI